MRSALYVLPLVCNVLVSSSVLTPLKSEGLRIFKDAPSDFEYVLKRHDANDRSEDPDSKERRSNMGSSFIRYGRSGPDAQRTYDEDDGSTKVDRYPRFKSPDIVIRFGRSGYKNGEFKRGRNDLNFIRYGRNVPTYPVEIDVTAMCTELLSTEQSKDLHPYEAKLLRLCDVLNSVDEHRNSLDFLQDSKHD
ncbi:FMRFamide-related peptides-like [Ceratina calcarata]|uniref:FMRFamide-related peptides-like n=1 Tax=Ceratina calcarata TaxID=156304 RepID=A0AAJ7IZ61_9HYME|nr:FMRFamide-related peptides-like [Ceratina calcarata]